MISIDIGKINTGFAIINEFEELTIGLLNITTAKVNTTNQILKDTFESEINKLKLKKSISIVLYRGLILKTFFNIIFDKFRINKVIIERQSQHNPTAQEIEYMITGLCLNKTNDIIIFNPINKFSYINIKYDTKNKAHKKLSINIVHKLLEILLEVNMSLDPENDNIKNILNFFNGLDKKDDIADAIYMLYITYDIDLMKDVSTLI